MKNSKTILVSALTIALFSLTLISGCKKESNTTETCTDGLMNGVETGVDCGGGSCNACLGAKIKTFTYPDLGSNTTETFTYDSAGRVSTIVFTGARSGLQTYACTPDSVIVSQGSYVVVYPLNNQGYAASQSINGLVIFSFIYNTEGYLISETGSGNTYTWNNGNLTGQEVRNQQGTITYTYTYSDKINTIGNENMGMAFLGKSSRNLQNSYTTGSSTNQKEYEFDLQNRVIREDNAATFTYY